MKKDYHYLIMGAIIIAFGFGMFAIGYTTPRKAIHTEDREQIYVVERFTDGTTIRYTKPLVDHITEPAGIRHNKAY